MSVKAIMISVFLLLLTITLFVPSFPPAKFFYESLKIPLNTSSLAGFPVATILNAFTNGFFWLLIAAIIYGIAPRKEPAPLPSMPAATPLSSALLQPTVVDWQVTKTPPASAAPLEKASGSKQTDPEIDIEIIDGISTISLSLLRNAGIFTVKDLLEAGSEESGRRNLSSEAAVPYSILLKWIHRGDLLRVRGIDKECSALLELAGINNVTQLSGESPQNLLQTLMTVNKATKLVEQIPPIEEIEIWVNNAKNLKPIIK